MGDWDFWLRVAADGGALFHVPKIGFDYRVRSDSMIVKTIGFDYRMQRDPSNVVRISPRLAELVNYIFGKPELAYYKLLRETDEAIFNARQVLVERGFRPAWKQIRTALRLSHSPRVIWEICSFFGLWFQIITWRVKRRIKSKFNASGQADSSA